MDSQSKIFNCNVCEQSFDTSRELSIHNSGKYTHDGLQRNERNEIVFICNICNKTFRSQRSLYNHRRISKHALMDSTLEPAVNMIESMKEPAENIYSSDGCIRNEISHEKERVIELSTSLALGSVQDAVKRAFRSVREEMIPLYVAASVEQSDAMERIHSVTSTFENGLLMTLMHDTFNVADKLKNDLESL